MLARLLCARRGDRISRYMLPPRFVLFSHFLKFSLKTRYSRHHVESNATDYRKQEGELQGDCKATELLHSLTRRARSDPDVDDVSGTCLWRDRWRAGLHRGQSLFY